MHVRYGTSGGPGDVTACSAVGLHFLVKLSDIFMRNCPVFFAERPSVFMWNRPIILHETKWPVHLPGRLFLLEPGYGAPSLPGSRTPPDIKN